MIERRRWITFPLYISSVTLRLNYTETENTASNAAVKDEQPLNESSSPPYPLSIFHAGYSST